MERQLSAFGEDHEIEAVPTRQSLSWYDWNMSKGSPYQEFLKVWNFLIPFFENRLNVYFKVACLLKKSLLDSDLRVFCTENKAYINQWYT